MGEVGPTLAAMARGLGEVNEALASRLAPPSAGDQPPLLSGPSPGQRWDLFERFGLGAPPTIEDIMRAPSHHSSERPTGSKMRCAPTGKRRAARR